MSTEVEEEKRQNPIIHINYFHQFIMLLVSVALLFGIVIGGFLVVFDRLDRSHKESEMTRTIRERNVAPEHNELSKEAVLERELTIQARNLGTSTIARSNPDFKKWINRGQGLHFHNKSVSDMSQEELIGTIGFLNDEILNKMGK